MSKSDDDAGAHRFCGPEPLFPRDDIPAHHNIRFVTFCALRADGEFVRLETFELDHVRCWDDAKRVLCAGLYRAVGMDDQHRPVAMHPPKDGGWVAIVPGVEPCVVPDSAVVAPERPAAASPTLDPTLRAWLEADAERIRADAERLRAEAEYVRKRSAWMDTLSQAFLAMTQSPPAVKPGGKPN